MSPSPLTESKEALTPAVLKWAAFGTGLQVLLVVVGHYGDRIYSVWPVPSLVVGVVSAVAYTVQIRRSAGDSVWHGAMVAAIGTFLGTALAAALADAPALDLAIVTLSGTALGAATGLITFVAVSRISPARSG